MSVHKLWLLTVTISACCFITPAEAQLRVAAYNTNFFASLNPRLDDFNTVFAAIGADSRNGVAAPLDAIAIQEVSTSIMDALVGELNSLYGPGTYARAAVGGGFGGAGQPGLLYNTQTLSLVSETAFGSFPRAIHRYQLRPVGYDSSADFFLYSNHYKAGESQSDQSQRLSEAIALRNDLDSLGDGVSAILAGDYNIPSPNQAMYVELTSPGPGQAFDPIEEPGTVPGVPGLNTWRNNPFVLHTHTQSPSENTGSGFFEAITPGFTGGGMDDRFDFQLTTGELIDGEGLSYIGTHSNYASLPAGDSSLLATEQSYNAFGNDGSHQCCNSSITTGTGAAPSVLAALAAASDHLPVVADYQLPGILEAVADAIPSTLPAGTPFELDIVVSNAAPVSAPVGADEVDYVLTTSGDAAGSATGSVLATLAGDTVSVSLDTATPGAKSAMVTISSNSQSVQNGLIELAFDYLVEGALVLGDVDLDGDVDASDIDLLYANLGSTDSLFDLDADGGAADLADVNTLVQTILGTEFGDANLDGAVDAADFSILSGNFNAPGGWAQGNFDGVSGIAPSDFSILSGNFNFVANGGVSVVPEPASAALLVGSLVMAFAGRRVVGRA